MEALKIILENQWQSYSDWPRPHVMRGVIGANISIEYSKDYFGKIIIGTCVIWFNMDNPDVLLRLFGENNNRRYFLLKFDNIEDAQQHVDQFLERISKIKAFL